MVDAEHTTLVISVISKERGIYEFLASALRGSVYTPYRIHRFVWMLHGSDVTYALRQVRMFYPDYREKATILARAKEYGLGQRLAGGFNPSPRFGSLRVAMPPHGCLLHLGRGQGVDAPLAVLLRRIIPRIGQGASGDPICPTSPDRHHPLECVASFMGGHRHRLCTIDDGPPAKLAHCSGRFHPQLSTLALRCHLNTALATPSVLHH
jgi:hypothetical protein